MAERMASSILFPKCLNFDYPIGMAMLYRLLDSSVFAEIFGLTLVTGMGIPCAWF